MLIHFSVKFILKAAHRTMTNTFYKNTEFNLLQEGMLLFATIRIYYEANLLVCAIENRKTPYWYPSKHGIAFGFVLSKYARLLLNHKQANCFRLGSFENGKHAHCFENCTTSE